MCPIAIMTNDYGWAKPTIFSIFQFDSNRCAWKLDRHFTSRLMGMGMCNESIPVVVTCTILKRGTHTYLRPFESPEPERHSETRMMIRTISTLTNDVQTNKQTRQFIFSYLDQVSLSKSMSTTPSNIRHWRRYVDMHHDHKVRWLRKNFYSSHVHIVYCNLHENHGPNVKSIQPALYDTLKPFQCSPPRLCVRIAKSDKIHSPYSIRTATTISWDLYRPFQRWLHFKKTFNTDIVRWCECRQMGVHVYSYVKCWIFIIQTLQVNVVGLLAMQGT